MKYYLATFRVQLGKNNELYIQADDKVEAELSAREKAERTQQQLLSIKQVTNPFN